MVSINNINSIYIKHTNKTLSPLTTAQLQSFGERTSSRIKYDSFTPTYDTFTGLKDKNTLLSDLGKKMYKKEDISIGMFDMDNFKSINELLGYKVGDEFIKAISQDISEVAKKHKVDAYRFGGDEFVVLLFSGMDKEDKLKVIDDIIATTSQNPIMQGKRDVYMRTSASNLQAYEESNSKIKSLISLRADKELLDDIYENATVAREDPYVQHKLFTVGEELDKLYHSLTREALSSEEDRSMRKAIKGMSREQLTDYLIDKFDKSHELYRLRKWMKDFDKNGFNLTGGVATFKHSYYKGKQPIDLINEVGEYLKESKSGRGRYYVEME